MPDEVPVYCWDSSVWLSYLNNYQNRISDINAFLLAARQTTTKQSSGRQQAASVRLIASALVIPEVAFVETEKASRALSHEEEQKIDALLSIARLVSAHDGIMRDARSLIRQAVSMGIKVPGGADAVHLATARRMKATEFHTYDRALLSLDGKLGIVIRPPQAQQPTLPMEPLV